MRLWALDVWGELVPSKIFNPPFPVLKAGHSVSYSCICDVCREWINEVVFFLFFLNISVWLVCYAHFSSRIYTCMCDDHVLQFRQPSNVHIYSISFSISVQTYF